MTSAQEAPADAGAGDGQGGATGSGGRSGLAALAGAADTWLLRGEETALVAALALAIVVPLIDALGRPLGGFHIPGSALYVQQLTLWLAFLGGLAATRHGTHLTLSTSQLFPEGSLARRAARLLAFSAAAAVVAVLAYASAMLVATNRQQGNVLPGGLPEWVSECVMPVALGLMALRFAWGAGASWRGRAVAVAAVGAAFALGLIPSHAGALIWPLALAVVAAALLGAPVFVAMGGLALLLFFADGTPVAAVSAEVYRLIASPTLPAIPLLTAAGYVLAESGASARLVRFFRALFGGMPGGMAVMVAAVCALFTTFTGGSGVTIIALGGLVYPMLRQDGYPEGFSLGLVTAAGSLGLLFPPSLPVVLYSVVASSSQKLSVPAESLYLAGLVPGLLLVVLVALYGIYIGKKGSATRERQPFTWREVLRSGWAAKWELLLPGFVIGLFASGAASLVETAAAACAYAVVFECFVAGDIPLRRLPGVVLRAAALMGAVLILLSVAMGLTGYLVEAQIPDQVLAWVQVHIHSQIVFLLALNGLLLVLGSVLEIYSAIIILAPLIAPIGAAFGVDPIHLGVIFLANLELGFLFPPVGLNLFLSSSRFGQPLPRLYRHVLPFLAILGVGVLLITYLPSMSLGILKLLGK
ncbi:MAG TPA: TRAP transporter large permease subunit [Thermoanaerobaculia bacterium]|jgi:C4-dicarboxylate transporter DctM subunit|nr:TRAP transporter large permease subunit [Thermoanaerobaculia bacterium]